ncbi:MAG: hypothetical protein MJ252_22115 [archaeon]|nr:hypothetical protein [archaeon]
MEEGFYACIADSGKNFWQDYNKNYVSTFFGKVAPLKNYLTDIYNLSPEEADNFLSEVELDIYKKIKSELSKNSKEIGRVALDDFKQKFWYEENGDVKNWNKYSEDAINDSFRILRTPFIELFDQFKNFNFIRNPLEMTDLKEPYNEEATLAKVPEFMEKTPEQFLKQNEVFNLKKRFEAGSTQILEDAKKRREGFSLKDMPYWFYALLAFFGYDDVFRWLKNIYMLIFVIVVGVSIYLLIHFDKFHYVTNGYYEVEERFKR